MLDFDSKPAIRAFILEKVRASIADHRAPLDRDWWQGMDRMDVARINVKRQYAAEGIADYEPAVWLGRSLEATERQRFARELAAMERDGLLLRLGEPRTWGILLEEAQTQTAPAGAAKDA